MRSTQRIGLGGTFFVLSAATDCAPSLTSAMREQHAQTVVTDDRYIAETRAGVHDAWSATRFADAVETAVKHEQGFQLAWKQVGAEGTAPQRADTAALVAEATRYLDEAATREPGETSKLLTHRGDLYATALDWAQAAASYDRVLARAFEQPAFEGYVTALDHLGRSADVKSTCRQLSTVQAARVAPPEGTLISPEERANRRYPFLAACVQHEHEPTVDAALDWASAADRDIYVEGNRREQAAQAKWEAEQMERERARAAEVARLNRECPAGCVRRQNACRTSCGEDVGCLNACVELAEECVRRCPVHE